MLASRESFDETRANNAQLWYKASRDQLPAVTPLKPGKFSYQKCNKRELSFPICRINLLSDHSDATRLRKYSRSIERAGRSRTDFPVQRNLKES